MSERRSESDNARVSSKGLSKPYQATDDGKEDQSGLGSSADGYSDPRQCSENEPDQGYSAAQVTFDTPTAKFKLEKLKVWERVLKDDYVHTKLLEYVDAPEILVHLYYFPKAWADKIKATHQCKGRQESAQELLDYLPKIVNDENNWGDDFCSALDHCRQDLLVELLKETYTEMKNKPEVEDEPADSMDDSMRVGSSKEDFNQNICPAAQALHQHRQLWERTFRENKKLILDSIEPKEMLQFMPYLPRDRIRAVCNNDGRTRGADELVESLFRHTDKAWMTDFIDALRTPRINQNLIADLLTHRFRDLLDKTERDPKYKDLHDFYAKAEKPKDKEGEAKLFYYGARKPETMNFGAK